MAEPVETAAAPAPTKKGRTGPAIRGWTRAIHRDLGNLAVGLTFVYACSGIAVNHIADWDPNFKEYNRTVELGGPIAGDDEAAARTVLEKLGIKGEARDIGRGGDKRLEITLDKRTLHVDTETGRVVEEGESPRFFLRVANWLHLNRGKKAWTYAADFYAGALLLLALTGIFMLPGRKGLIGRGGIFVLLGVVAPITYVAYSGGPEKKGGSNGPKPEAAAIEPAK